MDIKRALSTCVSADEIFSGLLKTAETSWNLKGNSVKGHVSSYHKSSNELNIEESVIIFTHHILSVRGELS